jgi:ABC-type Zn uptake system ZnuABC Zn-binding protein ZnuA
MVLVNVLTTKEEEDGTKCNYINNNYNTSIAQAIERQLNTITNNTSTSNSNNTSNNDGGYNIYDFVDHLNNHILGEDWITNGSIC